MADKDSLLGEAFLLSGSLNPLYHQSWSLTSNTLIEYFTESSYLQSADFENLKEIIWKPKARYITYWHQALSTRKQKRELT